VETQILIAGRLNYIEQSEVERLMEKAGEVGRLLNGLSNSLLNK
ncbi:MAG: four helix bundle protein, partial [Rubrivivax sp.]|nr:four helix bundle protein [Pyrinomonadaceae bacterium]